jgi:hypothetical protein
MSNLDSTLAVSVAVLASCFVFLYLPYTYIKGKAKAYDLGPVQEGASVGGWLLVILVAVFSTGPLISILAVLSLISAAHDFSFRQYTLYAYALSAVIIGFNVWAMIVHGRLITTRRRRAVEDVKKFYIYFPFAMLCAVWLLSALLLKSESPSIHKIVVEEVFKSFFGTAVTSALYYWYFAKSSRVASLYTDVSPIEPVLDSSRSRGALNPKQELAFVAYRRYGSEGLHTEPVGDEYFPNVRVSTAELLALSGVRMERDAWEDFVNLARGDEVVALAMYLRHAIKSP